ncbi:MAG: hypothetical protein ABIZ81_01910 [Opitutaceae bacterium]
MKRRTQSRAFGACLIGAVVLLSNGCATRHEIKVDAISQPSPKEVVSYKLKTKAPPGEADSLRMQEATEFIKTALSGRGLYEAPNPDQADMVVDVDFGIEAPRVRMEVTSVPIYAQVGGGVRYEQVSVRDAKGVVSSRTVPVYEPPRTEMIGYRDVITPVSIYEKYLRISAHENKAIVEGKPPAEIWSVSVKSEDESKDLRKYLPLLASATVDYIGKDTKIEQVVKVGENDATVTFVKKGL